MVINHNLDAMNAQRQLGINRRIKAESMEKLSSGYKINRAADDAAGLAISEKIRRLIRGLSQGVCNAQDGVSVCKIADAALSEVCDMLLRITELSVKSANGTNSSEDRAYMQQEVSQLLDEIDHIGYTTEFNEIPIFNGEDPIGGESVDVSKPSTNGPFFQLFGSDISKTGYMQEPLTPDMVTDSTSTLNGGTGVNPYVSVSMNIGSINIPDLVGTSFFVNCCTDCCPTTVTFTDGNEIKLSGKDLTIGTKMADGTDYTSAEEFNKQIVTALKGKDPNHVKFAYNGPTLYIYDVDNNSWSQDQKESAYFCDSEEIFSTSENLGKQIWIQSGNEAGDGLWLNIEKMNATVLGVKGINISSVNGAKSAIGTSKEAMKKVMINRSRIGAQQNRIEHTIANEENIVENLTAAESQIRDTDMSKEMVRLANTSILEQAGNAILAQANQSKQYILGLLQ